MSGMNSLSEAAADTEPSHLPNEVWEIILMKVKDPQDLLNCSQVSRNWKEMLDPIKKIWLFPQVLRLILTQLSNPDILNCRRVCQGWKISVDTFLASVSLKAYNNFSYLTDQVLSKLDKNWLLKWQRYYSFNNAAAVEKFMNLMKRHSPSDNPFIGQQLELHATGGMFWQEVMFWQMGRELLDKFGGHICVLMIVVDRQFSSKEMILLIKDLFNRVPNIKKFLFSSDGPSGTLGSDISSLDYDHLSTALKQHPFPELPHCKHLLLEKVNPLFYEFVFARYLEQLNALDLSYHWSEAEKFLEFINTDGSSVANLRELHISVKSSSHVITALELQCPLKILRICINNREVEITEFLKLLHHFGETLEVARLEFEGFRYNRRRQRIRQQQVTFSRRDQIPSPNFPRLRILSIQDPPLTLDYLTWFGKAGLGKLHINWTWDAVQFPPSVLEVAMEKVEVYGWIDSMYESNIWKKLPFLEEIKFDGFYDKRGRVEGHKKRVSFKYSRKGYENMKENGRLAKSKCRETKPVKWAPKCTML